jgi:hypothetical protein
MSVNSRISSKLKPQVQLQLTKSQVESKNFGGLTDSKLEEELVGKSSDLHPLQLSDCRRIGGILSIVEMQDQYTRLKSLLQLPADEITS